MKTLPKRKLQRKKGYDYTLGGAYFITICTYNKQCILSKIIKSKTHDIPGIELTRIGAQIENALINLKEYYDGFEVDNYVIMPNHIHFVLLKTIENSFSISELIKRFKTFTGKQYENKLWQKSFYDHIIRNEKDYEQIVKYIYENPSRWIYDDLS